MQFGLFMMPLHPPHRALADGYDRDVAQIVLADQLGFREAWVGEHLTERWETAPAPDLLIAKALALTKDGEARHRGDAARAAQTRCTWRTGWPCSTTWPGAAFNGGSAGAASRPICRSWASAPRTPRRCGRAPPRCWTSCSGCGRRKVRSRTTALLSDRHARARSRQGPRVLHETLPAAASAHRGGGQHARLWLHANGRRARLDPDVELTAVPAVSRRPLAPGRRRRPAAGAAGEAEPLARRARRAGGADLGGARERAHATLGRNYLRPPAPQPRGHDPDDVDEAHAVHPGRGRHRRLPDGQRVDRRRPVGVRGEDPELYEESGGFGTLLSITTDSDDAGWDHESLRLLMEKVAPRVSHLG